MRQRQSDVPLSTPGSAVSRTRYAELGSASRGEPSPNVLSVSAASEYHDSLRRSLNDPDWRITPAFSCHQAITCLCRDRMSVIVCDSYLPDGTWRDILSHIAELNDPAAVIVTSKTADPHLRAEVRTLGGYDVLTGPFSAEEVRRVLIAAQRSRTVAAEEPALV